MRCTALDTDVDHCGTYTSRIAPHHAPEEASGAADDHAGQQRDRQADREGVRDTPPVVSPRSPPARPAAPALTAKATTLVRATEMPDSDAAISSSRTARKARPNRLRMRLPSSTSMTSTAISTIHDNHRSRIDTVWGDRWVDVEALLAARGRSRT